MYAVALSAGSSRRTVRGFSRRLRPPRNTACSSHANSRLASSLPRGHTTHPIIGYESAPTRGWYDAPWEHDHGSR